MRFAVHTFRPAPVRRTVGLLGAVSLTAGALFASGLATTAPVAAAPVKQFTALQKLIAENGKRPVVDEHCLLNGTSTWSVPTQNGPPQETFLGAFAYGLVHQGLAPAGANDWKCKPKEGRNPVVLVHGTWENAYNNWSMISPALKRAGHCVFALNYGTAGVVKGGGLGTILPATNGTGDIVTSGKQIAKFQEKVRKATGAEKVDMVGHSQGGASARQYLRYAGGKDKVEHLVTIAATNNGTDVLGLGLLARMINDAGIDLVGPYALLVGVAAMQQLVRSPFIRNLNKGGVYAVGDVKYTVIATRYDEVVTPYQSTFFPPGTKNTRNVTLQDGCEVDWSDHLSIVYSPRTVSLILNAFNPSRKVICAPNAWMFG